MSLFNPLIKLWYQHNNPQNWFPYIFLKNELREYDKDQSIFTSVIILSSTITFFLGDVWIYQKKITVCHSDQSKEVELPLPMLRLHYTTESSWADIKII